MSQTSKAGQSSGVDSPLVAQLRINTPIGYPTQIGILVDDIDRAEERYGEMFGIKTWNQYLYDASSVPVMQYRGHPGSYAMRLSMSGENPQVELIEVVAGPSIYHEFLETRGAGLHHLGVFVEDLRRAEAEMTRRGYEVIQRGSGYGLDGDGAFAYFDTDKDLGVIIEAIEVPKRRRPPISKATPQS